MARKTSWIPSRYANKAFRSKSAKVRFVVKRRPKLSQVEVARICKVTPACVCQVVAKM